MASPQIGNRLRNSTTRPVASLLELLGRRASLRILWELREQSLTFRAVQEAAQTNPSVLNARLSELRDAGLVEHDVDGYALTLHGRTLAERLGGLQDWADAWARRSSRKRKA